MSSLKEKERKHSEIIEELNQAINQNKADYENTIGQINNKV